MSDGTTKSGCPNPVKSFTPVLVDLQYRSLDVGVQGVGVQGVGVQVASQFKAQFAEGNVN